MPKTVAEVLSTAAKDSHRILTATFADVDGELANRSVPGTANRLGTAFAHLVLSEDAIIHGLLQGRAPLSASSREGRTGVDLPMPQHGEEGDLGEWNRNARIDVDELRDYAAEVFEATERYLETLEPDDFDRMVTLPFGGMPPMPLSQVITMLVLEHCANYSGEISAIKGTFGLKGYPF